MKYRTLIEIVNEAENKNEAIDIAGEFLRGNLSEDVEMKCMSKPLKPRALLKTSILFLSVALLCGVVTISNIKNSPFSISLVKNYNAIQPPLTTPKSTNFKETWQEEENKKVIEYIKR